MTPYPYPQARRPGRAGLIGIAVTTFGTLLLGLSMAIVWYAASRLDHVNLQDIAKAADASSTKALPHMFFGWLLWVLWAATVVLALLANLPSAVSTGLRVISPTLGLLGALLVYVSLDEMITGGASVFDHATIGLWLALTGFVITGLGGAIGPRRGLRGPGI
jgi:hypothetical protein